MKKRICALFLSLFLLVLCGCTQPPENTNTTTVPTKSSSNQTTSPSDSTVTPTTTEPVIAPSKPVNSQNVRDIENFTRLLNDYPHDRHALFPDNYYYAAMHCQFACPEELPLADFFYNGFPGSHDVTDEEQAFVSDFYKAKRLEPAKMNEVLLQYFDITLDDINWDVVGIRYWDKTGCYYTLGNDDFLSYEFTITRVEELENDTFKIYYYNGLFESDFVITLQSRISENRYGYRILSNLPE